MQESIGSVLSHALDLHSDLWQVIPFPVSFFPSEQGENLLSETRNVGLDLRKTTYRVMIWVCYRDYKTLAKGQRAFNFRERNQGSAQF